MFSIEAFAARLRKLRTEAGYSRNDIEVAIGIPVSSLGNYERGDKLPNVETLAKLCAFYHVPADYVLCVTDQPLPAEWPSAMPLGATDPVAKIKTVVENMISDAFLAPYAYDAMPHYAEIFHALQDVDRAAASETKKMQKRFPGFKNFGRFDDIKIDGVGLREALVKNNKKAREYVAAYDEGLAAIQERIGEVSAKIAAILHSKVAGAVTCGAVLSFSDSDDEDLQWPPEGRHKGLDLGDMTYGFAHDKKAPSKKDEA